MTDQRPSSAPRSKGTGGDIDALLNKSSLGSVGARRLRAHTPMTTRTSILDQVADRRNRETPPGLVGTNRTTSDSSAEEDPATSNDRQHVVPNPHGGWEVREGDAQHSSSHHDTRADAQARARDIVHNAGGGEVIVHGRDGAIRAKDTVTPSSDQVPPRG